MSTAAGVEHEQAHVGATTSTNVKIWITLVVITLIEVFLAYENLPPTLMLTLLVGLSLIKSALIMSIFMHLKFEKFQLVLWLIPATIFCITMMLIFFFPEARRLLVMRPH